MERRLRCASCDAINIFSVIAVALLPQCMAQTYPGSPARGDVFMGTMKVVKSPPSGSTCPTTGSDYGLRITVDTWYTNGILEYYPISTTPSNDQCNATYGLTISGGPPYTQDLIFQYSAASINSVTPSNPCNWGNLMLRALPAQSSNLQWGGSVGGAACASTTDSFTVDRQIGFEYRSDVQKYANLITCSIRANAFNDGNYQTFYAVFSPALSVPNWPYGSSCACDLSASDCITQEGGTHIVLAGQDSELPVFYVPQGTRNFKVSIEQVTTSSGFASSLIPLAFAFIVNPSSTANHTNAQKMWFFTSGLSQQAVANNALTDSLSVTGGNVRNMTIKGAGGLLVSCVALSGNTKIGGECTFHNNSSPPLVQINVVADNDAAVSGEIKAQLKYSYTMKNQASGCLAPEAILYQTLSTCEYGCCPYDRDFALTVVHIWANEQHSSGLQAAQQAIRKYGSDYWSGIPFYMWQAAWNTGLSSWTSPWSPYWSLAFRHMDANMDGYISMSEYAAEFNKTENFCPQGYLQQSPFIMGCDPSTGSVTFSFLDSPLENSVTVPSGTINFSVEVQASQTIDLRILDISVSPSDYVVYRMGGSSTPITQSVTSATWQNVQITYTFIDTPHFKQNVTFVGTMPRTIRVLVEYANGNYVGLYRYSSLGGNCSAVPPGCALYNLGLASIAAMAWAMNMRFTYSTALLAWQQSTTAFHQSSPAVAIPMIPFGNFGSYWRSATTQQLLKWSSWNDEVFQYTDVNKDRYVTQTEFTNIYEQTLVCQTGQYSDTLILVGCTSPTRTSFQVDLRHGHTLPMFKVPADMTGFKATFFTTLPQVSLQMVASDLTASPLPQTAGSGSTTITITEVGGGGSFPATITKTASQIELHIPGTTMGDAVWWINNAGTADDHDVSVTVTHSGTSSCSPGWSAQTSSGIGCSNYNASLADELGKNWSTRMSIPPTGKYSTCQQAWTALAYVRQDFLNLGGVTMSVIPMMIFSEVWCDASMRQDPGNACNSFPLGFRKMDINNDLLVDQNEFCQLFGLAAALQAQVDLTDPCDAKTIFTQSDFPLANMNRIDACQCSTKLYEGWDDETGMCMKRRSTHCSVCSNQVQCATTSTIVGSGLQEFLGDCPYVDQINYCVAADQASLSFPTIIVVDEADNIYIADHGNNRVRMVEAATSKVKTIVGNGEKGFSGDGGDSRDARIRHPSGLAVNFAVQSSGGSCQTLPRVVYFSDFYNQRVRRVTQQASGVWIIETVLGTGEQGSNPACDAGCPAASAILNNPRTLALSKAGDLYIVDSGNRKIRKFSISTGNFSTFLGIGYEANSADIVAQRWQDGVFLTGSWEEDNSQFSFNSVYNMQLDRDENLWIIDGMNNRLVRAPLIDQTVIKPKSFIGRYTYYFQLHFGKAKDFEEMVRTMVVWLGYENAVNGVKLFEMPYEETIMGSLKKGRVSWKYAKPMPDYWCEAKDPRLCPATFAQNADFFLLSGICFDVDNAMYVTDQQASQVMSIRQDAIIMQMTGPNAILNSQKTIKDCPCLQYWADWHERGAPSAYNGAFGQYATMFNLKVMEMCTNNPSFPTNRVHPFLQVPCKVQNYCINDPNSWCYINTTAPDHGPCSRTQAWDFCRVDGRPETFFMETKSAGILGNEMRRTERCVANRSLITGTPSLRNKIEDFNLRQLNSTFTCDTTAQPRKILPWATFVGFEEPRDLILEATSGKYNYSATPNRPTYNSGGYNCANLCCGLKTRTDKISTYCLVTNEFEYDEIFLRYVALVTTDPYASSTPYLPALPSSCPTPSTPECDQDVQLKQVAYSMHGLTLVWQAQYSVQTTLGRCKLDCENNPECKAFVFSNVQAVAKANAATNADEVYVCVMYNETWPFNIYEYNRSANPVIWNTDPVTPYTRLFNFAGNAAVKNAYVNTNSFVDAPIQLSGYLSGPHANGSLLFTRCQALCEQNSLCNSIAWPGCYLFNYDWTSIKQVSGNPSETSVWIKVDASQKVHSVTGTPNVRSSASDKNGQLALTSLINQPGACAVDSKGDLLFADTWNHKIRKISNLHVDCQYNMELFTKDEVTDYRNKINAVDNQCFTGVNASFSSNQAFIQWDIVQKYNAVKYLCQTDSSVTSNGLTQNIMVLCSVCREASVNFASAGCPSRDICNCRDSIVNVLADKVFLNCPAQSAYYETWHKFISAYVMCWAIPDTSHQVYMVSGDPARDDLIKKLQNL